VTVGVGLGTADVAVGDATTGDVAVGSTVVGVGLGGGEVRVGVTVAAAGLSLASPGKVNALISSRFETPSPSESIPSIAVKLCPLFA
jgi:hypothetical protein